MFWFYFLGMTALVFVFVLILSPSPTPPPDDGRVNPALICPHCQMSGNVRVKPITKKVGISGAKATGALLTGGLSVLVTGLSRTDDLTEAHCGNCSSTWRF